MVGFSCEGPAGGAGATPHFAARPLRHREFSANSPRTRAKSGEVGGEVEAVEPAAGPDGSGGVAEKDPGAAKTVEAFFGGAGAPLQRFPRGGAELRVAREGLQQPA